MMAADESRKSHRTKKQQQPMHAAAAAVASTGRKKQATGDEQIIANFYCTHRQPRLPGGRKGYFAQDFFCCTNSPQRKLQQEIWLRNFVHPSTLTASISGSWHERQWQQPRTRPVTTDNFSDLKCVFRLSKFVSIASTVVLVNERTHTTYSTEKPRLFPHKKDSRRDPSGGIARWYRLTQS